MAEVKVSTRYANALINEAQDKNVLKDVFEDLKLMNSAVTESHDLRLLLKSPIIKMDKKKSILSEVFNGRVSDISLQFLDTLVVKGREEFLGDITNVFFDRYNEINDVTPIEIVSAVQLDKATTISIIEKLKSQLNLNKVEMTSKIDANIGGGLIIKIADQVYDLSIANKLNGLKKVLTN